MKKLYVMSLLTLVGVVTNAQTTEYETGTTIGDPWTGWSTPVVSNTSGSVNGANIYMFSGTASQSYTLETYRQFTINSNDIDLYLTVSTQDATASVEYSSDNISYTEIGTQNWGSGLSQSTLVIPTYDPVVSTYYLKIKVSGTFGSPSTTQLVSFRIDAVVNAGAAIDEEENLTTSVVYSNGNIAITSDLIDYTVSIADLSGKLISYGTNVDELDLTNYKNGLYILSVISKEGTRETFKINHVK
jgi:hypothetical protein